jgi:tetratricopeptide (TPR) repeat protein
VYEALLGRARDLKRRSRTLRDQGLYREAAGLLQQAIDLLSDPVKSAREAIPPGVPASPDVRDVATELADCWGSLGGVLRREADALRGAQRFDEATARYHAAIAAYDRGLSLEQDDRFRIANSYNLVQRVVVPVLTSPGSLNDQGLQHTLREIGSAIQRQIDTTRPGDAWALSDLGLVQLLMGEEAAANETWNRMDDLQPQRNVYTSGLPVLEALATALPELQPVRRAARRFRASVPGR